MTAYVLKFTPKAEKDIRDLDTVTRKRMGKKLILLTKDPIGRSKRLTQPALGQYRYRIGDYRIVFDIAGHDIIVLRAGHRREIYR